MMGIPYDVMVTALDRSAKEYYSQLSLQELAIEFAEAILEERERCASLCERTMMGTGYNGAKATHAGYVPSDAVDKFHQGAGYAALIRDGGKK